MARVLVVEDDGLLGYDLKQAIENHTSAAVWVAPSTARAFDALALDHVDFVILDVHVLDGHTFGLARYLSSAGVPFVFVSGTAPSHLPADLREHRFFRKPLDYASLHQAMQPALRVDPRRAPMRRRS
jgi:DNA-binding response OmpR family regulator